MSDNCDHNFGTFDDFGVKNYQKVSHNMILMSKYKGQHGGKKGQKIRAGVSPPLFGQCPKENIFSLRTASLSLLPFVVIEGGDFQLTCAKKHLSGLLNPDSVCKKRLQSFRNDLCTSPPSTSGEWERVQSVRDRAG